MLKKACITILAALLGAGGIRDTVPFPDTIDPEDTPPETVEDINAQMRMANFRYFKSYLSECPENEIRCLWFLGNHIRVGMVMTINLRERTVYTVREVYNRGRQSSRTRHLGPYHTDEARDLLPELPPSAPYVGFAEGVHVACRREDEVRIMTYSKSATPFVVRRLYDLGGGASDFVTATP
ncbi:hypothetical protein DES53_11689 [Roseimicrobium gellanilyticum]|uniref:Uncharacterized protein n=1 Tax=Roseimicrobium gellanilyticum TaxID=748857 RepID=A0A366H3T8_9BACT|nr:hypothetical protein [Roseimicrobium gellanilyticum]RBP36650.1 hypothetical protein DES53_11689 [Roseimicrobium gellanilyticum]